MCITDRFWQPIQRGKPYWNPADSGPGPSWLSATDGRWKGANEARAKERGAPRVNGEKTTTARTASRR